jgi:hypothetical protein
LGSPFNYYFLVVIESFEGSERKPAAEEGGEEGFGEVWTDYSAHVVVALIFALMTK